HVLDLKEPPVNVASYQAADLRDPNAVAAAIDNIGGRIDALFNAAGLPGPPFSEVDTMLVNFVGARHLIEALTPKMPEGSSVGMIASAAAVGWQQNLTTINDFLANETFESAKTYLEKNPDVMGGSGYWFSKQVINAWVGAKGADLIRQGIRLNCINPGPTATPMMPQFHAAVGKDLVDSAMGPIGRYSQPAEQAWPLVMLNSPRMSYVTCEQLWTDGGFLGALTMGKLQAGFAEA
ncbi:MAG: SDR family oxidoreductase, partial [Actinobacteria bacterium]|nr:SDR family oxidoreductase [Actinomycetota bacterium]